MPKKPDIPTIQIRPTDSLSDPAEIADALLRATDSASLGLFVWDLPGGRMLWNEAMYALYELDPARFDGSMEAWLATLHPDDLEAVSEAVQAALRGERRYDINFRVRRGSSEWRYVKGTAWVEWDVAGRPLRMAGINQDISASEAFKQMVDTVRRGTADRVSHSYFESLVLALSSALGMRYAMVAQVCPLDAPKEAHAIALSAGGQLGEPLRYALAGTPCARVLADGVCLHLDGVQQAYPDDALLGQLGAECYLGVPLRAADGRILGLLEVLDVAPLADAEAARRLLDLFAGRAGAELERLQGEAEVRRLNAELEARVSARTEELRRTMRELEAFTYSVSHDLSAPMRAIHGFGSILREDYRTVLDATGQDYLDRTLVAAERMGRLLDDLVSLSKISLRPLAVGKVNLSELCEEIVADLQQRHHLPGLRTEISPHLVVHADPGLMRILLDCLLRNAWQFMEGVAQPGLELLVRQHAGHREIVLRDNGRGFDAQALERLFTPFQQVLAQGSFTGSGTGLAMAQRIVLRHHGGIRVESAPGEGASFCFWLPPAAELMALLAGDPL